MAPKFGTSGLRGLVTELTTDLVTTYVRAFLAACCDGEPVYVGRDLRASSPAIAAAVINATRDLGIDCVDCGAVPTPALALAAQTNSASAIMITGSHIPSDRNGLKFYHRKGEITKADEHAIAQAYAKGVTANPEARGTLSSFDANAHFLHRYTSAFPSDALSGQRIGVYRHSSVARDLLQTLLEALGATCVPLGHAETFVPVDTEAVAAETRTMLAEWVSGHDLDAIVSTDGDADRPMIYHRTAELIPGDTLGVLTAQYLDADAVVTPISSNDMIEKMPAFKMCRRTAIGSPFVIAAMDEVLSDAPKTRLIGYEANGGFLLGFRTDTGLEPLLTRDCVLPIVAPLAAAGTSGLAALLDQLPQWRTAAGLVREINTKKSQALLARLKDYPEARSAFFTTGTIATINTLDGLRVTFDDNTVVHLRPSGNAPEFRLYAQAKTAETAVSLVQSYYNQVAAEVTD